MPFASQTVQAGQGMQRGERGSALILFARKYVTSRIFFPFSSVAKVNKIHYEFLIITAAKDKACQREEKNGKIN